ncbi:MAG: DNA polymerase beta superfamily protein [Beijerinckiaceae bacterium]
MNGKLDSSFDPDVVAQINSRLDAVIRSEQVAIPWAIESGSRAWGFPSPDSDYDCRFIFVRPRDTYLGLFSLRDVIETPLTEVLDVNGWDIAKSIKLMLKGNAVIIEWLTSQLVYRGDAAFQQEFLSLAEEIVDRGRIAKHYVHLAYSMRSRIMEGDEVKLKKLFYVLRPIIALRWLRQRPDAKIAPMNFQRLCAEADLSESLAQEIASMVDKKAITRELGSGSVSPLLQGLIHAELTEAEMLFRNVSSPTDSQVALANQFFLRCVDIYG